MFDSTESKCQICTNEYDDLHRKKIILHDTGDARDHAMCASCYETWVKDKNNKKCPDCNSIITEPQEHKSSMQKDDHITRLKQIVSCKTCSECGDESLSRCSDCRIYLCGVCKAAHIKKRSFRSHTVHNLADLSPEEIDNFEEASICEDDGLVQDMYCTQCKVACCLRCEGHTTHKVKNLGQVLKDNSERILTEAKVVLKHKEETLKQVNALEKSLQEVESKTTLEQDAVNSFVQKICQTVQKQGEILKGEIQDHNSQLSKSLDMDIRKRKDILEAMVPIESFLKERKPMGDIEALNLQKKFMKCTSDIEEIRHAGEDSDLEAAKFVRSADLDVSRFKIGYVQGSVQDDDRSSLKGYAGLPSLENEIRMLIIGNKKSGRTRTSFALMVHETKPSSRVFKRTFKNKSFCLRRSPGIDVDKEKDDIKQFTGPGPHIIILCVKNPDEDVSIVNDYADVFNGDMMRHMIVIFTGKRELLKKKISLEKYVQTVTDEALKRILKSVGGHMIAVSTDDKDSLDAFRDSVFQMASDIVSDNGLRYLPLR